MVNSKTFEGGAVVCVGVGGIKPGFVAAQPLALILIHYFYCSGPLEVPNSSVDQHRKHINFQHCQMRAQQETENQKLLVELP